MTPDFIFFLFLDGCLEMVVHDLTYELCNAISDDLWTEDGSGKDLALCEPDLGALT